MIDTMARASQDKQLEGTVARIVAATADEIAQAVRQNIAEEVARMVGQRSAGTRGAAPHDPVPGLR